MNRVVLLGNLGADPELRTTSDGLAVLNLRLATTEVYFDKNKERKERTDWHNVVMFGNRAEALAKLLFKGACIAVEGGLRTSSYERDGVKRYKTDVVARDIYLTGRRADAEASGPRRTYAPPVTGKSIPAVLHEELPF